MCYCVCFSYLCYVSSNAAYTTYWTRTMSCRNSSHRTRNSWTSKDFIQLLVQYIDQSYIIIMHVENECVTHPIMCVLIVVDMD